MKDTQAYIDSGVTAHVDGDIDVSAKSDEDITSEEAEDRREKELTIALSIAGDKAKPFPSLINADPKELLAYLSRFGVRTEDVAALAVA